MLEELKKWLTEYRTEITQDFNDLTVKAEEIETLRVQIQGQGILLGKLLEKIEQMEKKGGKNESKSAH